ncbi:hypothetical protein WR25_12807 isoform D [Diploscapter pachys]|uniref:SAM domain-containing protein n=2 Tax=Diploscapter pachys TaxID=2018661 RepID=A0A2A2KXG7_9BILA|nr:hypothetical protein WR25_12807 isoform D [Diploscapter pachys]
MGTESSSFHFHHPKQVNLSFSTKRHLKSSEYSDSTVASSCSLPMISNISTTPPSVSSPKKSLPGNELDAQQLPWTFDVRFRHPKSATELPHHKSLRNGSSSKSIDLEEEWKKIDDIIASYGAAACRESVFERDYLQKVAVFLRDRSSKALTVLNTRPNSTESRNIPVYQMETADWLMRMFSMPETEAQQIGAKLCDLGYDKYTQMKGSLNRDVMTEVSIKEEIQDKIMRYLDYANDPRPNANHFNYVSDWLCSLELTEYLSNFFDAGYKSMGIVMGAKITPEILEKLSITKPGHVSRILYSLQQAAEETRKWAYEQGQEIIHSPRPNDNLHNRERSLMHGSVTFSAHYLGSAEVSNIDRTVESRNAMAKLKREVSDISRTSPVTLEISIAGVSVWEPGSGFATMEHPLGCIAIVCQDAKDLNCFAYISQESHTHFAHVFCVLTAVRCQFLFWIMKENFSL